MSPHRSRRLALLAAAAIPFLLVACSSGGGALPTIPSAAASAPAPSGSASADATHPGPTYPAGCPTAQPAPLAAGDERTVTISTDKGDIAIDVKGATSPIATANFVALADCGYYDGVVFHRLVPGFVIQGGDGQFGRSPEVVPGLVGTGGPPYTIEDEPITAPYKRGTVAMARTPQPNSVGSQFFIVLDDSQADVLNSAQYGYQIVGEVTSGMEVVDVIAAMPNTGQANGNAAVDPVAMNKVTVSTP